MCRPCVRSSRRGVKLNSGWSVKKRRGNGGRKSAGSRRNRRGERRRIFIDENRWASSHTLGHNCYIMKCLMSNTFVFYSSAVSSRSWSWSFCSRASSRACQGAQGGVEARQELSLWAKLQERAWDSWSWRQRDFSNSSSREHSSSKG